MDQQRFDELTRRLSQSRSRRAVLKGLVAGVTAGLIGASSSGVALAQGPKPAQSWIDGWAVVVRWVICYAQHLRDSSQSFCGGQCIDVTTDHGNCGACGNECASCETCVDGACVAQCDDNNICTVGTCDHQTGSCVYEPISCDDNNACTTDYCDPTLGCVHEQIVCDDDDPCTVDTCDPVKGCVFTPVDCNGFDCQGGQCV